MEWTIIHCGDEQLITGNSSNSLSLTVIFKFSIDFSFVFLLVILVFFFYKLVDDFKDRLFDPRYAVSAVRKTWQETDVSTVMPLFGLPKFRDPSTHCPPKRGVGG